MPSVGLLLRGLGVVRSVLGVGGHYRAASLVGLAVAIGWFAYTAWNDGSRPDYDNRAHGYYHNDYRTGTGHDDDNDRTGTDDDNDRSGTDHDDDNFRTGTDNSHDELSTGYAVRRGALAESRSAAGSTRWCVVYVCAGSARPVVRSEVTK